MRGGEMTLVNYEDLVTRILNNQEEVVQQVYEGQPLLFAINKAMLTAYRK